MLAVDTNVIVRYLTRDDAEQFAKASALIDREDTYVCTTVLLETEWVLRRGYRFRRDRIIAALTAFAGLPRARLEDPAVVARALDWARSGMDFADALHLAKAEGCDGFVSFDQRFAAMANAVSEVRCAPLDGRGELGDARPFARHAVLVNLSRRADRG